MKDLKVNPLLISALTKKKAEEISSSPVHAELPGKYVQLTADRIEQLDSIFQSNIEPLICKECGKKAEYDLGLLTINIHHYQKDQIDMEKYIQSTGYFRCKYCNSAGEWEITNEFRLLAISALLSINSPLADNRFSIGENRLFDGSSHRYASDAEEHLLQKIMDSPNDSYLWNRLGNLYLKGGRADLAICAFERSTQLDPLQTESLFSIGSILSGIGEIKDAAEYLHKMLASASQYTRMSAKDLRDILSNGYRELLTLSMQTDGEISLLPLENIYKELKIERTEQERKSTLDLDIEVFPDQLDSFYPIAELFMGERSKELADRKYFIKPKKKKRKKK